MELNPHCSENKPSGGAFNKIYLLVKIPANVKNPQKAVELLGGKEKLLSKYTKDDDVDLNLFSKKIPLEKCISSDFLIKRKRMRNKNNPEEYRYKFEIMGKVDAVYDYFALHDFICLKHDNEKTSFSMLESKSIIIFF